MGASKIDVGELTKKRNKVRQLVRDCTNCPLGGKGNNVPFFGAVYEPKFILVGEAPGEYEVIQQKPFVGRAGKLLWAELAKHKISRADVYSMNVCSCRPVFYSTGEERNRTPTKEEIRSCSGVFKMQLNLVSHCQFILALGNIALHKFKPDGKISDWNGKPLYTRDNKVVVPAYHPAAVLRDGNLHEEFSEAIGFLVEMVKLGDNYLSIWPSFCFTCSSDEVLHVDENGRMWCGACYLEEFQIELPGMDRAKPTKLSVGKSGKVLSPKRKKTP